MPAAEPISVLFVCLGNHCRSPSAHAIAATIAEQRSLRNVLVDSAGTADAHSGDHPHPLAVAEGRARGYRVTHVGRRIHPDDFERFALIIAMDRSNVADLERMRGHVEHRRGFYPGVEPHQVQLLRRWDPYAMPGDEELPDPWGKGAAAYTEMFDVIERTIPPLLDHLATLVDESQRGR